MKVVAGEVFLVNLGTGGMMVADHYALASHGMPEGYERGEDVSVQQWMDTISDATGNERSPMPERETQHDILVNLSTGESRTQHMGITRDFGIDAGYTDLDLIDTLDLLDAVRAARGLEPCDRSEFEDESPKP